jgi:hypothetical protein
MASPAFDELADDLAVACDADAMPFSTTEIEACAVVAIDLAVIRRRLSVWIDVMRFDDTPTMPPERRIHARVYNATLERLWREHRALGGDETDAAVLRVAADALAITTARYGVTRLTSPTARR